MARRLGLPEDAYALYSSLAARSARDDGYGLTTKEWSFLSAFEGRLLYVIGLRESECSPTIRTVRRVYGELLDEIAHECDAPFADDGDAHKERDDDNL